MSGVDHELARFRRSVLRQLLQLRRERAALPRFRCLRPAAGAALVRGRIIRPFKPHLASLSIQAAERAEPMAPGGAFTFLLQAAARWRRPWTAVPSSSVSCRSETFALDANDGARLEILRSAGAATTRSVLSCLADWGNRRAHSGARPFDAGPRGRPEPVGPVRDRPPVRKLDGRAGLSPR